MSRLGAQTFTHADTAATRYQDPFDDYKKRHAKKLAKRAEGSKPGEQKEKEKDDVNWFGLKVGSSNAAFGTGDSGTGGVGKYLNLKRPVEASPAPATESSLKKRKTGFGDFSGW